MNIILKPFAMLLLFFNNITGGYGLALILFALVVKVILFPFALKGKKSMIKTNMLQGELNKIQAQYANNEQKQQEEIQKLCQKEGVNPMGGCLWSLIPLLVLLPLYAIIRQPMNYLMGLSADEIKAVATALDWSNVAFANGWIKEAAAYTTGGYNEMFLASLIRPENLSAVQAVAPGAFVMNFKFLGLNLAQIPQIKFWTTGLNWNSIGLFLMPLVSAALAALFSWVSTKTNKMSGQAQQESSTSKTMMLISPIMSLWIGFFMPAGLCVYWIINNLLSIVQEVISGFMLKKDYEEAAEARRKRELMSKEEEKRRKAALAEERARRAEEKKKGGAKKKAAEGAPANTGASRVGIRAYARGRAYDPDRFGGVTPYRDPASAVDEAALEAALEKNAEAREEAAMEAEVIARVNAEVEKDYTEGKLAEEAGAPAEETAEAAPEAEESADETADDENGGETE